MRKMHRLGERTFEGAYHTTHYLHVKRDGEWVTLAYGNKKLILEDLSWANEKYPNLIEDYRIEEVKTVRRVLMGGKVAEIFCSSNTEIKH